MVVSEVEVVGARKTGRKRAVAAKKGQKLSQSKVIKKTASPVPQSTKKQLS